MKNTSKKVCLAILCILFLSAPVFADMVLRVKKSSAVIRQTPGAKGKIIRTVKKGEILRLWSSGAKNGWYQVIVSRNKKVTGWIHKSEVETIIQDRFDRITDGNEF